MKKLLMIGCLVMAACAGTGKGKIDEKTQEALDSYVKQANMTIIDIQQEAQIKIAKTNRNVAAFKLETLKKLGFDQAQYQLCTNGYKWEVLDIKKHEVVK